MSDSLYTASGKFLDTVDSYWIRDVLPFEDILVNADLLPAAEPELGATSEYELAVANENTWSEVNLEALLLPRNPVSEPNFSTHHLPRV